MNIARKITVSALAFALTGGIAFAQYQTQDNHNQYDSHAQNDQQSHYVRHSQWKRGYHMQKQDWNRGQEVDWRTHHLRQPPRGYEWREIDGNYVEAAIATGVIASVIAASLAH